MKWGKRACFCLWATCLFLGGNGTGKAADWVMTPSIEMRAEYLNNIFYSARFKASDYIASAVPSIDFSYNTEATQIGGNLRLTGMHYFHRSDLDTINQFYNIHANTLVTSRLKLNFAAAYLNTTNSQEAVNATNLFTIRQRVSALNVTPGLTYYLTERWSTDLSYNFYNVDYQSNPFSNYMGHTINSRLNYLFNEKTTFITSITASYYQYQKLDNTIINLGPQVGLTHKFSENWDLTILGGAQFSQIESNVATTSINNIYGFGVVPNLQKQKTSYINPFINIIMNKLWQNGSIHLTYIRTQSPNAYQNQSQYNYFNLYFNQNLSEKLSIGINPYFNINTIQGGRSNYDQYYYGISPRITYKLTEKTSVGVNYRLSYVTNNGLQNYSYNVNDVYVFLNYSYPLHYQH